ncbi:MAG TPA: hypothetical protein DDW28_07040 [Prevotella sp.]|nr:hypothetical protein [Candidatus Segatella violae]
MMFVCHRKMFASIVDRAVDECFLLEFHEGWFRAFLMLSALLSFLAFSFRWRFKRIMCRDMIF